MFSYIVIRIICVTYLFVLHENPFEIKNRLIGTNPINR